MTDLRRALHDLAADPAEQRPVEEAPDVLARARRRRRTRVATVAATTLATVGAVAVAGAALVRTWEPPLPADTPAPAPTASAAPPPSPASPTPVALPAGRADAAPGTCGWIATAAAGSTDLALVADAVVRTVHDGLPVAVWVGLSPTEPSAAAPPAGAATITLVRDGVAVAVSPVTWPGESVWGGLTSGTWVPTAVCDDGSGSAAAGAPLPGGAYEVVAVAAHHDGAPLVASGGTIDLGPADTVLPAPAADGEPDLPTVDGMPALCGAPWPATTGGDLALRLSTAPTGTLTHVPPLDAAVEYTGPGTLEVTATPFVEAALLRDGVVVAATLPGAGDAFLGSVRQPHGLPRVVSSGLTEVPWSEVSCDGATPAPGDYELVAYVLAVRPRVLLPDGSVRTPGDGQGTALVLGSAGPFPVTIG